MQSITNLISVEFVAGIYILIKGLPEKATDKTGGVS